MSTQLFPSLPGLAWSITRTILWATRKVVAISGKETAIADWSYPRYTWELVHNVLRQGSGLYVPSDTYNEMNTLFGFYNSRQGGFDSFLYQDQDDNAITGQLIAVGDGATIAFQLVRAFGGFVEPILAPNIVSQVALNGVAAAWGGLAAPAAPTLSQVSGGTLSAVTYFAKVTYVTIQGETVPSGESSLAVSVNNLLKITSPSSASGAIGYNVYVSTASGTETKQNSTPIAIGTPWTEPTSGLISGSNPPASSPTWTFSSWGAVSPGVVTFSAAPGSGVNISASFTYYWPCRFVEDKCLFEKFMSSRYRVKKLIFESIK